MASKFTNRTFGIELEAYGVDRHELAQALREAGVNVEVEGYNHQIRRHWKIVTDASINGHRAFELVSPVLSGEAGLAEVRTVCAVLVRLNAQVNRSCGFHVHHFAQDLDLPAWKRLVGAYVKYEGLIDSFMPTSRRAGTNMYCRSLRSAGAASVAADLAAIRRVASLQALQDLYSSRYKKLNLQAFYRHGTVEFRHHSGTVEPEKVENWIRFTQAMVEFSVNYYWEFHSPKQVDQPDQFFGAYIRNAKLRRYYEGRALALAGRSARAGQ